MRWRLPLSPYEWKLKWIDGASSSSEGNKEKRPGILEWLKIKRKVDLTNQRSINLGVRQPSSNMIRTHIYYPLLFLPIFVYSQFKQFANLIFLILSIIQVFPGLSPFGKQSTMVPLATIMFISAIRELYEDVMRRYRDAQINDQKVWGHTKEGWKMIKWKKIHVGQLIRVDEGDQIPCDMLLISSSQPAGVTYIETANLDGESNLKIRQALPDTAHLNNDTGVEIGIINKTSSNVTEQVIKVTDTKGNTAILIVKEHIPRSTDDKIKIRLVHPPTTAAEESPHTVSEAAPAPSKVARVKGQNNLGWTVELGSGEIRELLVKYPLEHPKEEKIEFSEKF